MAEKTLKTRIIHKHDTEAHWILAKNFIPKQAEIIVYDRDDTYNYERFKIGDGITVVSALPFVSSEVVAATTTTLGGIISQETTVVDGEKLPVVVEADGKANVHVALYDGAVEGGGETGLIIKSSTEGSSKYFKLTVDDNGNLSAVEINH